MLSGLSGPLPEERTAPVDYTPTGSASRALSGLERQAHLRRSACEGLLAEVSRLRFDSTLTGRHHRESGPAKGLRRIRECDAKPQKNGAASSCSHLPALLFICRTSDLPT